MSSISSKTSRHTRRPWNMDDPQWRDEFETEILDSSNAFRQKHHSPALTVNAELARVAQEWADYLAKINKTIHRPDNPYGENIYYKWHRKHLIAGNEVSQSFYNEIKYYYPYFKKEPNLEHFHRFGHFSQMLWRQSEEMGTGIAVCGDKIFIVINYHPRGNWPDEYAMNVLPAIITSAARLDLINSNPHEDHHGYVPPALRAKQSESESTSKGRKAIPEIVPVVTTPINETPVESGQEDGSGETEAGQIDDMTNTTGNDENTDTSGQIVEEDTKPEAGSDLRRVPKIPIPIPAETLAYRPVLKYVVGSTPQRTKRSNDRANPKIVNVQERSRKGQISDKSRPTNNSILKSNGNANDLKAVQNTINNTAQTARQYVNINTNVNRNTSQRPPSTRQQPKSSKSRNNQRIQGQKGYLSIADPLKSTGQRFQLNTEKALTSSLVQQNNRYTKVVSEKSKQQRSQTIKSTNTEKAIAAGFGAVRHSRTLTTGSQFVQNSEKTIAAGNEPCQTLTYSNVQKTNASNSVQVQVREIRFKIDDRMKGQQYTAKQDRRPTRYAMNQSYRFPNSQPNKPMASVQFSAASQQNKSMNIQQYKLSNSQQYKSSNTQASNKPGNCQSYKLYDPATGQYMNNFQQYKPTNHSARVQPYKPSNVQRSYKSNKSSNSQNSHQFYKPTSNSNSQSYKINDLPKDQYISQRLSSQQQQSQSNKRTPRSTTSGQVRKKSAPTPVIVPKVIIPELQPQEVAEVPAEFPAPEGQVPETATPETVIEQTAEVPAEFQYYYDENATSEEVKTGDAIETPPEQQ